MTRDDLLHVETCALIAVVVSIILPWWAGGLVAILAGFSKELWDIKHGVASVKDLLYDFAGAIIGASIALPNIMV